MPAFHHSPLLSFIASSDSELTGLLSLAYARDGLTSQRSQQTIAWAQDIFRLRETLQDLHNRRPDTAQWTVLLEFNIPRKLKRIDVVLLAGDSIVILEQKSHIPTLDDCRQAEEYALLLHYFHQPSNKRKIIPLVVSPTAHPYTPNSQNELPFLETAAFWIEPVERLACALPFFWCSRIRMYVGERCNLRFR